MNFFPGHLLINSSIALADTQKIKKKKSYRMTSEVNIFDPNMSSAKL